MRRERVWSRSTHRWQQPYYKIKQNDGYDAAEVDERVYEEDVDESWGLHRTAEDAERLGQRHEEQGALGHQLRYPVRPCICYFAVIERKTAEREVPLWDAC